VDDRAATPEVAEMSETEAVKKIKLLVVDDEVDFLAALAERLEMRDFEVRTVTRGDEALALCRKEKFDLALIDLKMPGMDGRELLDRIKSEHEFIEVIILTGHGSLGSAVECAKSGAFSYLPKPYQLEELLKVLQEAYTERMKKKFIADKDRTERILELAQGDSPRRILRRMRELDNEDR
jgi:DNA-binding NtrC family response regulator